MGISVRVGYYAAVTITKYQGIYHFSLILHAHCRQLGALFQVILTLGPKYHKWPWQRAQDVVKHALALNASAQK